MLLLAICGALLIFFSQHRLWRSALILMGAGQLRRHRRWAFWLSAAFLIAAMFFGLLAFARLGKEDAPAVLVPPQLYVLLDCSISMNAAAWTAGSRLELAKRSLRDLPAALPDWELGLLTFAGEALLDFPPSGDHGSWLEALAAVAPERPPWSGSAPGRGMQAVAETRSLCSSGQAAVLLLSDGEVNVENRQQEEEAWRQRDLPCLFVLVGEPGEKKVIPDSSGWLSALLPEEEPVSVAESHEIEELLALSSSSFLSISGQAALQDTPGMAKSLERLLRQSSGPGTEGGTAAEARIFLLLSAACALLALFSSSHGLPRLTATLALFFCGLLPISVLADEAAALELCRQAVSMTEHPEESQQALELYRRALRLQPGLALAARNLEYTLLQMQKMTSAEKNIEQKSESDTANQASDEKPKQAGALPPQSAELTDQQAEKSNATAESGGTWRDLQKNKGKIFRAPPKCKPW
jgi:sulfur relay (sulfurtransferase) DsrF/TusC family protein